MISLSFAAVLTVTYLASRNNSSAIGLNITDACTARWVAESGVSIGTTIFETKYDWRNEHTGGVLLEDVRIGQGAFDITITDLLTGLPPDDETEIVLMTATGTVEGSVQTATAVVETGPAAGPNIVDVGLSEFAVFVDESTTLKDDSIITRWDKAPANAMGDPIALGTRSLNAGSIQMDGNAATVDLVVYSSASASGSLIQNNTDSVLGLEVLDDRIPLPDPPPAPEAAPGAKTSKAWDLNPHAGQVIATSVTATKVLGPAGGVFTLDGEAEPILIISQGDFKLPTASGLVVQGTVDIVVDATFILEPSSFIELKEGATLTMYLGGDVSAEDAYIGDARIIRAERDNSGSAAYVDVDRLRIFSGTTDAKSLSLIGNTVVKSSLYMPNASLSIKEDSALYGRAALRSLTLENNAAIYYDAALNTGNGYTNPSSPLFSAGTSIKASVMSLASLSTAALTALSTAENLAVLGGADGVGMNLATDGDLEAPLEGDATDRSLIVEADLLSTGSTTEDWEGTGRPKAEGDGATDSYSDGTVKRNTKTEADIFGTTEGG